MLVSAAAPRPQRRRRRAAAAGNVVMAVVLTRRRGTSRERVFEVSPGVRGGQTLGRAGAEEVGARRRLGGALLAQGKDRTDARVGASFEGFQLMAERGAAALCCVAWRKLGLLLAKV